MNDEKLVNDILNKSEPTEEELNNFKHLVNEWFKYDDMIRKLNDALKERKNYQKVLNNKIEEFMFRYKYADLNTQNGRIKAKVKEIPKPINMKEIKELIIKNNSLSGKELLDTIFSKEDRPLITKKTIKRIIPKVSLALDI